MLPPTSFPFALEKEKNFSLYAWKKETSFPSLNQSCSISEVFKEKGAGRFGVEEGKWQFLISRCIYLLSIKHLPNSSPKVMGKPAAMGIPSSSKRAQTPPRPLLQQDDTVPGVAGRKIPPTHRRESKQRKSG